MNGELYRVTLADDNYKWSKKTKPLYIAADSKDKAVKYVEENLKAGAMIKSVSYLGNANSGCMWSNPNKTLY